MSATTAELAFLSAALKAPRIEAVSGRLAQRARDEGWDYEAYLAAVLTEEVSSRDSHGGPAPGQGGPLPGHQDTRRLRLHHRHLGRSDAHRPPRTARLPGRGQERRVPGSAGHGQDQPLHRARRPGLAARPAGGLRHGPPAGQPGWARPSERGGSTTSSSDSRGSRCSSSTRSATSPSIPKQPT